MKIVVHHGDPLATSADLLVVGVWANGVDKLSVVQGLDRALRGALRRAMQEERFTGAAKQRLLLHTAGQLRTKRLALVGLGVRGPHGAATLSQLAGCASRLGNRVAAQEVLLVPPPCDLEVGALLALLARGALLGGYRFDRYRSKKARPQSVRRLQVAGTGRKAALAAARAGAARGLVIAEAVALARDLVNEPAADLYPESFARRAAALARPLGLEVRVLREAELARRGMRLLLAVGAGSARPPRLVHLRFTPRGRGGRRRPVVLVGKGITFDAGGLCLKSPESMAEMKADMAGAAAVLATMQAVARLQPGFPVHAVLALAENMPSGTALRVGDVVKSAAGKTVEVTNTDAEGRLVLADALHYASTFDPVRIIDVATLTRACVVALGPQIAGLFTEDDTLAAELLESAERAGEQLWRLPLPAALKEQLKSEIADLKNSGDRFGGASVAALFLEQFVGQRSWAHLDIAGPATSSHDEGAVSKGGTGFAVATLVELLTGKRGGVEQGRA